MLTTNQNNEILDSSKSEKNICPIAMKCFKSFIENIDFDSEVDPYFYTTHLNPVAAVVQYDSHQELPKSEHESSSKSVGISPSRTIKPIHVNFSRDVLQYVIPLTYLLTFDGKYMNDFITILKTVETNPNLLQAFEDQAKVWWKSCPGYEACRLNTAKCTVTLIREIVSKISSGYGGIQDFIFKIHLDIQNMIDRPLDLLEFINRLLKPKESEKREYGEVFTPIFVVNQILDMLDQHHISTHGRSIFSCSDYTWLDPANGMGNFPIVVYHRLMKGLEKEFSNEELRRKHIFEKMLWMVDVNPRNCILTQKIFNLNGKYKLNLYNMDSLQLPSSNFTVIMGNPPYNQTFDASGAKPLYHKFVEKFIDQCQYLAFIIPTRWFAGGKGLDGFRKNMLARKDIRFIKHFDNASDLFEGTDIMGGVQYIIKDSSYSGPVDYNGVITELDRFDIFVEDRYHGLINRITSFTKTYGSIVSLYKGRCYGIESNDKRLTDVPIEGSIVCYVSQQKGFIKYIHYSLLKPETFASAQQWKVITSRAYGSGSGSRFGNIFIGKPWEVHTGSYISFEVSSQEQAINLEAYLKTKLSNFLLSLRKISQDISEKTLIWIPMLPLSPGVINYTLENMGSYFGLNSDDLELIRNANIKNYNSDKLPESPFNNRKITVAILKAELALHNIPVNGNRSELIAKVLSLTQLLNPELIKLLG